MNGSTIKHSFPKACIKYYFPIKREKLLLHITSYSQKDDIENKIKM